ncbi:MAG: hypothetical protein AAFN81_23925 [Bacteroidota bacterium]
MLKKKRYFIKIQKGSSLVRFEDKTLAFTFEDAESGRAVKFESQISDFVQFEAILESNLKKLDFKSRPWIKNVLYFSIANSLDEVQLRTYFDSADHVDAAETFLVRENIAILVNPQFQRFKDKNVLVIGLFNSKIEFSVIRNFEFEENRSYYCDPELLNVSQVAKFSSAISETIRDAKIDEILVVNERNDSFFQELKMSLPSYELVNDRDNLILTGLEIAAKQKVEQVIVRLTL